MKALFIITRTNEMHKHCDSWSCLGNEYQTYTYTHQKGGNAPSGGKLDDEILAAATEYKPEVIIYVGACRSNTPSIDCFVRLKRTIAPIVHLCSDAADEPWWDELIAYHKAGAFSVQVAIDGNKNWPLYDTDITALTPIDPSYYPDPPKIHAERSVVFGFAGNIGSVHTMKNGKVTGRRPLVAEMITFGLKYRERPKGNFDLKSGSDSYKEAAQYMSDTRIMPNFSQTGSFERMHVKGRVVEAGLAGCLLLEPKGSPTPDWFEPGVDYLQYDDMKQAKQIVSEMRDKPEESQEFGIRLRRKIEENHSPEKFWGKVMERL